MITVGFQHSPRERIFEAVIDSVEVKKVSELSRRDIEHDNPEFRRLDEMVHFLEQIYGRKVEPRRRRDRGALLPDLRPALGDPRAAAAGRALPELAPSAPVGFGTPDARVPSPGTRPYECQETAIAPQDGGSAHEAEAPGRSRDRQGDRGGGDHRQRHRPARTPPRRSRSAARSSQPVTAGGTRMARSASRSTWPRATRSSTRSTAAPRSSWRARICSSCASRTCSPKSAETKTGSGGIETHGSQGAQVQR